MTMMMQLPELNAFKDIPGYKAILKAVIRSQIQFLVEQLSHQVGEESVLLTASLSDGTLSHLGSESGKVFLERNDDFKSQFLGFCIKRHHSTISRTAVKKKPPTAKRSVPFGFKTKPKRQHSGAYPIGPPETIIQSDHNKHIPEITADLPTPNATAEAESLKDPVLQESVQTENTEDNNDDAASDKTIENYPIVKTEPVDESDIVDNAEFEGSFETSMSRLDTSITNGEEKLPAKKVKKRNLPSNDQTGLFDNASVVKLEYPGNEFMTNEAENSADISQSMQDESASFDYGESSGVITEQQLFFSQADTPKRKRHYNKGGSKPCKCEFCGRIIKRGSDMKKHLRIHTGVKPFSCDFCGKQFNQSSALSIHRRIHTGEKPYGCDRCGSCFRRRDALVMHQKQCLAGPVDMKVEKNQ